MGRVEIVSRALAAVNARDFEGIRHVHTVDAKFFAPGVDLDLRGRDAIVAEIRKAVEEAEMRYEVQDIFEQGPFVVVFARTTGVLDGYPMGWDLCGVYRFEQDQIAETWVMRGSAPQPLG